MGVLCFYTKRFLILISGKLVVGEDAIYVVGTVAAKNEVIQFLISFGATVDTMYDLGRTVSFDEFVTYLQFGDRELVNKDSVLAMDFFHADGFPTIGSSQWVSRSDEVWSSVDAIQLTFSQLWPLKVEDFVMCTVCSKQEFSDLYIFDVLNTAVGHGDFRTSGEAATTTVVVHSLSTGLVFGRFSARTI